MRNWSAYVRTSPGAVIKVTVQAPDAYTAIQMLRSMYGRENLVNESAIPE